MNTNARPLSGGIASKNVRNASRPPAEAPMPTTIGPGVPQSAAVSEVSAAVRCGTASSGLAGAGLRAVFDRSADLFAAIATYPLRWRKRYSLVYRSGTGEDMGSVCRRPGGVRAYPMGQRALETARSRATGG